MSEGLAAAQRDFCGAADAHGRWPSPAEELTRLAADNSLLDGQGFPQVARLELDEQSDQLIARARDVQATQGRLRGLLWANLHVARAVDLDELLRHLLEAARDLVDARYAALGVVDQGRLVRFLHTGMDAARIEAIGHLPDSPIRSKLCISTLFIF